MFSATKIPSIGVSIGIERLMVLLEQRLKNTIRDNKTQVLIATIGKGLNDEKLKLANMLWENNINTEYLYELAPKTSKHLDYALEKRIPFIMWIGESEIQEKTVKIKCTYKKEESSINQIDMITYLNDKIKEYDEDVKNG